MAELRALFVDDKINEMRSAMTSMRAAFQMMGWELVCEQAEDAESAIAKMNRFHFDFAIVDLFLPETPDGLDVIRRLRHNDDRSYILAISARDAETRELLADARDSGATDAVSRGQLGLARDYRWGPLAATIRDHCERTGLISVIPVDFVKNDLGVLSLIEDIGRDPHKTESRFECGSRIIGYLVGRCLGRQASGTEIVTLSFVRPGKSGAFVCRADVQWESGVIGSYIMKLGLDLVTLRREQEANESALQVLGEQTLVPTKSRLESHPSGFHGFLARLAQSTTTLGDWLGPDRDSSVAANVARVLFSDLSPLHRTHSPESTWNWLRVSSLYRLRVEDAIGRFIEILQHPSGCGLNDASGLIEVIAAYVTAASLPVRSGLKIPDTVRYGLSFGDLHSGNILVYSGPHPRAVLVDAAQFGRNHWSADAARLVVDLSLRVRARGVPSLLWDDFGASFDVTSRLCPICGSPSPTTAVEAFVGTICRELTTLIPFVELDIVEADWHWQWHVGLAMEFLRQTSHVDIPPPRAALALASGGAHLRIAGSLLDARR